MNNNTLTLEVGSVSQFDALKRELSLLESLLSRFLSTTIHITLALSARAQRLSLAAPNKPQTQREELKYCFEILGAKVQSVLQKN